MHSINKGGGAVAETNPCTALDLPAWVGRDQGNPKLGMGSLGTSTVMGS